jgi:2-dehydropantoate 2-reductase
MASSTTTPTSAPPARPPRILIFGTGSLGIVYTWVLSRAVPASHITAVCRSNYAAAARDGLTVHSTIWGDDLRVRPVVARSVDEAVALARSSTTPSDEDDANAPLFDYVLVTAKALPTTPSAAELIGPAVTPGRTAIVLVQNGVAIERPYAAHFPANPLLSAVAYMPATQLSPGIVRHREIERLHVGPYPAVRAEVASSSSSSPSSAEDEGDGNAVLGEGEGEYEMLLRRERRSWHAARRWAALFDKAGATAVLHADVQVERWRKLLVNGSWNPICALTRCRDRQFLDLDLGADADADAENEDQKKDEAYHFILSVMHEVAAVAAACGYGAVVNDGEAVTQIGRAAVRATPGVEPSMLADTRGGRRLEVDAIVGNTVRIARARGVDVPRLETIWMLARGLDKSLAMST